MFDQDKLPEIPVFNYDEDIYLYERRYEEYLEKIHKMKYDKILFFVNELLKNNNIKLIKLSDFKNIDKKIILKNPKYNRNLLRNHSNNLYKFFNIDKNSFENDSSDDIEDDEIIIFIKRLLNKINYSIVKKEIKGIIYYSIVDRVKNFY